ncbi:PilZ domain-containing protein [Erythrobacter dokdonensis]|uniref:PilZ domain-containing protein n=1 Tax=Erythrobacter dokdonensis DSW-74 TaxID=1300349 RepID=A0A1A7BIV8_9SPHN|nr:PilZ domain-containing protein [Erythrobacter dokdonensis]OBV11140.1 PilZ domain-containing protein [Erythrobacter dokdonensis DSW-74]
MDMDKAVIAAGLEKDAEPHSADLRAAPRFTLLIRAAKLVSAQGEFVCVIRDVSETGISVRLFHGLPSCQQFELYMPGGATYVVDRVWHRDNEAGFSFAAPVDVARLVNESGDYPKRGLRLGLCFPIRLSTLAMTCEAMVENLSQQGARIECSALLAIDQSVRIEAPDASGTLRDVRAKVRWRRGHSYGVVFDDTFTLGDFARLAARLQAPALLEG